MSDIINLLPDTVANQIAAGEVIQRPASVVKELVENSLDAGATLVQVIVKDAGKTLIQVADNGKGMSEVDARMSFERHATSKIQKANDLFNLHTMGFRGEALASIAAVAQVELKTRRQEDELGSLIKIAGGELIKQEPSACNIGTTFTIKNLFFNIPARRKFLKRDETEMRNIIQEIQRIALAHPSVEIKLFNDKEIVYDLLASGFKKRIIGVFGKKSTRLKDQLVKIEVSTSIVKVSGYVCKPENAKKKSQQFFFVNDRYMFHPYFKKAVSKAYERMISVDVSPTFFIKLEVDPKAIDVNIHPTKTEIKFEDEQEIFSILMLSIKETLGKFHFAPSIDFDTEGMMDIPITSSENLIQPTVQVNPNYNPFQTANPSNVAPVLNSPSIVSSKSNASTGGGKIDQSWKDLFEQPVVNETMNSSTENYSDTISSVTNKSKSNTQEVLYTLEEEEAKQTELFEHTQDKHLFQYRKRYLFTPVKSGLMIIDIKRAFMRVLYDELMNQKHLNKCVTQKLIFPEILELSVEDSCIFTEIELELKAVGFEIAPFGKQMYHINGVPAQLSQVADTIGLLEELIETVRETPGDISHTINERIAYALARATVRRRYDQQKYSDTELNALLGQLFATSNPNTTPDGKRIVSMMHDEELTNRF